MAETDKHRRLMVDLIAELEEYFEDESDVYVSGNLLVFFEPGNKRRHVAPDVFVVRGVAKGDRKNFLVWQEGKAPQTVIELTSASTRNEDLKKKFELYRDILKAQEYFLFDPFEDYLDPSLQGYRLANGVYVRINPAEGRLPSKSLGLHLERHGSDLRLYDPVAGQWLLTPMEARRRAEQELDRIRRRRKDGKT